MPDTKPVLTDKELLDFAKAIKTDLSSGNIELSNRYSSKLQETAPEAVGFGESKYDTSDISISTLKEGNLDEVRAQKQGILDKWSNGAIKAATTGVTSFAESTAGLVYGIADAVIEGDRSKVYNNSFTQALDDFNAYVGKNLPNYHTKAEQDYNLLQKLGTANFWSDQFLNGAAYMGAAIATGAGLSKFASLSKLVRTGTIIDEAALATKGWSELDRASKMIRIADATDFAKNAALMSHGESAIEARGIYNDTKTQLIKDYKDKYGVDPNEIAMQDIENSAKAASNWGYAANLAITGTTNALLFPKLLSEGYGANKAKLNNIELQGGKYIAATENLKSGISKELLKGSLEEGGQELGQLLTQKTLTDYYSRAYKDKGEQHDLVQSLIEGFKQTLGTEEGLENFFLGALMGGPAGAIQAKGEIKDQNIRTQNVAELLNNPQVKRTVNSFDNFVRATSYEKDKNEALANGSKFDYLNAEFNQNKSIAKQFIDNGAKDILIQQYKDMQGMPEEEFKKLTGYSEEEQLPKSQTEIINNAVKLVETLDKTNNAVKQLFPYSAEKYGTPEKYKVLTDNLWHYSTSIDNINKRIKELQTDVFKVASDKSVNITGDGISTPFGIEDNPLVAQQVNQINQDLQVAKAYKDKLIDSYNLLADPKTQEGTLEDIVGTAQKEAEESEFKATKEEASTDKKEKIFFGDENTTVDDVRLSNLDKEEEETITSAMNDGADEDVIKGISESFQAKREEILAKKQSEKIESKVVIPTEEVQTADTNLEQTVESVNNADEQIYLYGTEGKQAQTIYHTTGGRDNDVKSAEQRYFRFIDPKKKNITEGVKLLVVTKNNNPVLYNELLQEDPTALAFEAERPDYNGIFVVFVNKNDEPILTDQNGNITPSGKIVFSTLLSKDGIDNTGVSNKTQAKQDIENFRNQLLAQTGDIYLGIQRVSNGILIREKVGNNRKFNPVLGHITNDLGREGLLQLPTISSQKGGFTQLKNGQTGLVGKLYAFDNENNAIDLIPRTLTSNESLLITNLLSQRLGIIPKLVENPSKELEKLILFGVPKAGANEYTLGIKGSSLFIGTQEFSTQNFANDTQAHEALNNLLAKKYINVSNNIDFQDTFEEPVLNNDDTITYKQWNSYQEYLLSNENGRLPLFGTDVPSLDKPKFRNHYVIYDPTIVKNDVSIKDSEVKQDNTDPESTDTHVDVEIKSESENKEYKKSGSNRKIDLDRLKEVVKGSPKPVSKEEINWFKLQFPNIPLESVKGLIDNVSFGRFISNGRVLLSDLAPENTLRHEAWHVVEELYLTPKEQEIIHKEVKNRFNNKKLKLIEIKEILAEDFAHYKDTGMVLGNRPLTRNIFQKILDFLKKLVGLNPIEIRDIYNRIETGQFIGKQINNNGQFRTLDKALPGKTEAFTKATLDGIDYEFFDILFENGFTPEKLFQVNKLTTKIYDIIRDGIIDRYDVAKALGNKEAVENYEYILDNWSTKGGVLELHNARTKSLGIELTKGENEKTGEVEPGQELTEDPNNITEESIVEDENRYERSGEAFQNANTISTKDMMFKQTKLLIKTLPKIGFDGRPLLNELGLPQLVDFNSTYNYLLKNLAGVSNYPDMITKLKELSIKKPEFKILIDRIKEPSDSLTYDQLMFQNQFRQDFDKNQAISYLTMVKADGIIYTIDATREFTSGKVKEIWRNNLKSNLSLVKLDDTGKFIVDKKILDIKNNIDFLSNIGITFSKETLPAMENNEKFSNAIEGIKKYIIDNDLNITELYDNKTDQGNINTLLNLEAQYTPDVTELSFVSTEGKTVYSISLNNYMSIVKNMINNAKTKEELFTKLPHLNTVYNQNSLWIKEMFTPQGNRRKDITINLDLLDGLKTQDTDEKAARKTTSLSAGDKYVQELNNLLNDGKTAVIRTSDKSTEFSISLSKYNGGNKIPITIESVAKSFDTPKVKEIFRGYFKDELQAIFELEVYDKGTDIDIYRDNRKKWGIFNNFPDSDTWKTNISESISLLKDADLSSTEKQSIVDNIYNQTISQIDANTITFLKNYAEELENTYAEYGITKESKIGISKELLDKYDFNQLIRALAVNDFINSVEQVKLFFGDMSFYKDFFKRTAATTGTGKTARVDSAIDSWLNTNIKRKDGKLANGKINTLIFEDSKQSSNYLPDYISNLADQFKKEGLSQEDAEEKAESLLSAYAKMDEGDAQGWITLDEYREFFIRTGDWHAERIINKALNGEILNSDEITYLMPIKAVYFGPQDYEGLYAPAYHKYSLMPLIPQLVKGKNLEALLENMTANQVGYSVFKSGSKVGTLVDDKGKANKFYTNVSSGDINNKNLNSQVIDYRYLKIQLDIAPKLKKEVIFGTQFRKLLFSNLFKNSTPLIANAKELFDEYSNIFDNLIEENKAELVNELGIDPENYSQKDVTKLVELLRKEAQGRNLADNIIDALQTEEINGRIMLKYNFDYQVNKAKIDSMVMSLVNSRLIKQMMNGDAMIQGSCAGFESRGKRAEGSNELKFYRKDNNGKTLPMEVKVPLTGEYQSLLKTYGTLEEINKALKEGKIDKKLITMIGYRIPTQGLNSIEFMEIQEFLTPESGNLIVLPTEIVAKSGGDFDIDKLNIFRPYFNPKNNKQKNQNRIIDIAKEILEQEFNFSALITPNSTHLLTNIVDNMRYIDYVNKKKEKNEKFQTAEEYNKGKSARLKNIKFTDQLKLTTKVDQFTKFLGGKAGVGIGALQNTHHILSQIANLSLNTKFINKFNEEKYINIYFSHNKTEDGRVNLSELKDIKGNNNISEVISQIINASVDIAKDPFMFDLNMNLDTLATYAYLVRTGIEFEQIAYFMKQPIIGEFLKETNINKSVFLKATGNSKNDDQIAKTLEDKYQKLLQTKLKMDDTEFDTYMSETKNRYDITTKELESYLHTSNQSSVAYYHVQLQALKNYREYKEQAQMLSEAINSVNHDTAGLGSNLNASRNKEDQKKRVDESGFLVNNDNIYKNTFVGSFDQHKFTIDAYSQFYSTQKAEIVDNNRKLLDSIVGPLTKETDRNRLATLIENDFINYVVQNYAYEENIQDIANRLFRDSNSVAIRLLKLKTADNLTPEEKKLVDNILIKELQPLLINKDHTNTDNVRIYSKRFDTFTSNQLTEAFREIQDLDADFARDLMDLGIIQSGLNNSAITYMGLIPFEYYGDLVKNAFNEFDKKNGALELSKFNDLFLRNNTKDSLIWRRAKRDNISSLGNGMYGKNYDKNLSNGIMEMRSDFFNDLEQSEVNYIPEYLENSNNDIVDETDDNSKDYPEDLDNSENVPTFLTNWERLQNNPFGNQLKSDVFKEVRKTYLDKRSVDTSPIYDFLNKKGSLNRTTGEIALSELSSITFHRNGIPTYEEIEKILNTFKDDNLKFLKEYKRLLVDNKRIINDNFIALDNREEKLKQVKLQNELLLLNIEVLNSKLSKLGLPLLNNPITTYENQDKNDLIIINENKYDIDVLEKKIDKKLTGLKIWDKYDGKELTPDSFTGLCNATSKKCIKVLRDLKISPFPFSMSMTAKSPVGNANIGHYVALVNINNKLYIYDMPQTEFIKDAVEIKGGFKYIKNYDPRFIELTKDNLIKLYGNSEDLAEKNLKHILNYKVNNYSVKEYIEDTNIRNKTLDNKKVKSLVRADSLPEFKKEVGLRKSEIAGENRAKTLAKVKKFNREFGTNYTVQFKRLGESTLYTFTISGGIADQIPTDFNKSVESFEYTEQEYNRDREAIENSDLSSERKKELLDMLNKVDSKEALGEFYKKYCE